MSLSAYLYSHFGSVGVMLWPCWLRNYIKNKVFFYYIFYWINGMVGTKLDKLLDARHSSSGLRKETCTVMNKNTG